MKKTILLAAVATLMASASALAADLPARTYTKAPPPIIAPLPTWQGFYVGVMGGYGWSDRVRADALGVGATLGTDDLKGGFGGGTIGYNWQFGGSPLVLGIEVDAAGSGIDYSIAGVASDKIQALGSVTGRIGYAFGSSLIYAKGGWAWADNKVSIAGLGSESNTHTGYTVGGGLEYLFAPAWSAKVEYMYADFDKENYGSGLIPGGVNIGASVHTIKGGINYHFNWF